MEEQMKASSRSNPFRIIPFFLIVISWVVIPAGQLQAGQPALTKSAVHYPRDFDYIIGLGDILEVQVWREPDLSRNPVPVRVDGRISLPLLGDVDAAGKSIKELTLFLEQKYREVVTEPAVSVMLIESRSWRYYIVGQIASPGEYNLDYPLTVLQVIARSGGFLEWAKKSDITIIRRESGQEKILPFNYDSLLKGQDLSQNIHIAPGDTIIVP
jgi:polysaccharide export outer membrane protein